jgi:hypothetical protein
MVANAAEVEELCEVDLLASEDCCESVGETQALPDAPTRDLLKAVGQVGAQRVDMIRGAAVGIWQLRPVVFRELHELVQRDIKQEDDAVLLPEQRLGGVVDEDPGTAWCRRVQLVRRKANGRLRRQRSGEEVVKRGDGEQRYTAETTVKA